MIAKIEKTVVETISAAAKERLGFSIGFASSDSILGNILKRA
jgi:hypothetical protein